MAVPPATSESPTPADLPPGRRIRVLLADDHTLVRQGFRRILEAEPSIEVIGEADSGAKVVHLTQETKPDVVVLDIKMPGGISGLESARQIRDKVPSVRIVILSMHADETYLTEALDAGACGYLLKDSTDSELVQAVFAAHRGSSFLSPALLANLLRNYAEGKPGKRKPDPTVALTDREREVLTLVAQGKSSKEIAHALKISQNTVETHRARCMQKLGLHNTAELVLYAVRQGIVC